MSAGVFCSCPAGPDKRKHWVIVDYKSNYSAFSGYRCTPSRYSALRCTRCRGIWRTKAAYVDTLPLATREQGYAT